MEKSEKFQKGDVVKHSIWSAGRTAVVTRTRGDRVWHTDPDNEECWSYADNLVLITPATPAAEAKSEAWVPKVGDRVRVKSAEHSPTPSAMRSGGDVAGLVIGDVFPVSRVTPGHIEVDGWCVNVADLEPAPSAPAKAEEPKRSTFREKLEAAKARQIQHSPYQGNDLDNEERVAALMQTDKPVAMRNEAARLRNIAAAKAEMQLTSADRRARLGKHDARERDLAMAWQTASWEEG